MSSRTAVTAAVRGGALAGAVWQPDGVPGGDPPPTIVAVHGITASHLAWQWLADALPQVRIVAPDLRGRGRSRDLPGPWGMPQHAADVLALLDAVGADRVLGVGHSMGAFVVGALAAIAPERLTGLVFVDGGLPIPLPPGITEADLPEALIGPAARRLTATYPSTEAYHAFWRAHPAFADHWDDRLAAYADYDLRGRAPELRPAGDLAAVTEDSLSLQDEAAILGRLAHWPGAIDFLRAPRGLLDEVPPLYPDAEVARWRAAVPALRVHEIHDVNHYTILMSDDGVARVLPVLTAALEGASNTSPFSSREPA